MMNDDKYGCDNETKINQPAHKVFEAIISLLKSGIIGFLAVPKDGEGKRITLKYEEYGAEGVITVLKWRWIKNCVCLGRRAW